MEKNFAFLIKKTDDETIGLRFFPKRSHVHGFGDECPKSWGEVYKVYYAWCIFHTDFGKRSEFYVWDEGSALGDLADVITRFVAADKTDSALLNAFGDGADWDIRYYVNAECDMRTFEFCAWSFHRGFRFNLERDDAVRFAAFIRKTLAYMLEHSEPI
ncbi:MAG: hypothetical protein K2J77_01155 [Oscillospiraceae bacterium]|nr:hypothetical protein [Oscillospiraceae bacterium]